MPGRNQEGSTSTTSWDASQSSELSTLPEIELTVVVPEDSEINQTELEGNITNLNETESRANGSSSAADISGSLENNLSPLLNGNSTSIGENSTVQHEESQESAQAQPKPETVQRPRRQAAAAAKERFQQARTNQKRQAEDDSDNTASSPVRKTPAVTTAKKRPRKSRNSTILSTTADESSESLVSPLRRPVRAKANLVTIPKKKTRGGAAATVQEDSVNVRNLFAMLKSGDHTVTAVVDSWVEVYKADHVVGYLELANLFVHSAGCKGKITFSMAKMEHSQIIQQLTQRFDEDDNDYPLMKNDKEWKKFRADFCRFLQGLIVTIKDTILYDEYLLPTLQRFLSELSDSPVRAFRHTSTLGSVKLLTGLVDVAAGINRVLESDYRQLDQEEKKNRPNKSRLHVLRETYNEHKRQLDVLHNHLDSACKSIFFVRYRDNYVAIREICMAELGTWMLSYPQRYVDDSYLKYLGWCLNDKEAVVRRRCLSSILPLYEHDEFANKLHLFSNKFKGRFLEMTTDVDPECCVKASKVLIAMKRIHPELFDAEDISRIFNLVFATDRSLAISSAQILISHLTTAQGSPQRRRFRSGKEWSDSASQLYELIRFYADVVQQNERYAHCAYLVDSLTDAFQPIRDWQSMTDLLLEEPASQQTALSEEEERILVEMMAWSVKQTVLGESPPGRGAGSKRGKIKEPKQIKDDSCEITEVFMDALPKLMRKFKQDPAKLVHLISIPQYFDVDLYTTNHKEAELDQLLDLIGECFTKYDEVVLLKHVVKSLEKLEVEGSGIIQRVALTRNTLLESVISRLGEAVPHWISGEEQAQLSYDVNSNFARLGALLLTSDSSELEIWDVIFPTLERAIALGKTDLILGSLKCCMLFLVWRVRSLKRASHEPPADIMAEHMDRLDKFSRLVMVLFENVDQAMEPATVAALSALFDVAVVHCYSGEDNDPGWHKFLAFRIPPEDQVVLSDFVERQVFPSEPASNNSTVASSTTENNPADMQAVHGRRLLLVEYTRALTCAVIQPRCAHALFKHYISSTSDSKYIDLVKDAVKRLLELNPSSCAEGMAASIVEAFTMQSRDRPLTRTSEKFLVLKDMAKRLAHSFGVDKVHYRSAMGALHKYCFEFIKMATTDEDVARRIVFFDLLTEFVPKLLSRDKQRLVDYLNGMDILRRGKGDALLPMLQYRNTLRQSAMQENDEEAIQSARRGRRGAAGRGRRTTGVSFAPDVTEHSIPLNNRYADVTVDPVVEESILPAELEQEEVLNEGVVAANPEDFEMS